jgi:CheY-like chemotaxis protein
LRRRFSDNGAEAVKNLEQFDYDLVFMDCHMPDMDGYESTKVLRQSRKLANRTIPIVAMTAYNSKENMKRCIDSGMNDCLTKPLRVEAVRDVLQKFLATEPAPVSALDLEYLNRIGAQLGGDAGFQQEILEVFLKSLDSRVGEIDLALASGSQEALKKAAHALRSASQTVGASRIAAICERFEMGRYQGREVGEVRRELNSEIETINKMRFTVKPNREITT